MRTRLGFVGVLAGVALLGMGPAQASDGGAETPPADSGADDLPPRGIQPTMTPDNLGCSAAGAPHAGVPWGALLGVLAVGLALRSLRTVPRRLVTNPCSDPNRDRKGAGRHRGSPLPHGRGSDSMLGAVLLVGLGVPATVRAESEKGVQAAAAPEPAVAGQGHLDDMPLHMPNGRRRRFAISYNPFTLLIARYGGNVELMLVSHHVLIGSVYYMYTRTNDDSYNNVFRGVGGEIGYRYYFGKEGPRGLYISPSFLLGRFDAIPANGDPVPYWNFGGALDVGFQYLVVDRVVLGIGAGLQYTVPTATFPAQELPASIYAIRGLRPRLLLSLGVAF